VRVDRRAAQSHDSQISSAQTPMALGV